ncbi:MAG: hypothetical protein EPN93_10380 [Spirochaetes bacterium]|nr:MAG: hypothetical protein EPN93_10380 [Spirochaetota bacterium]
MRWRVMRYTGARPYDRSPHTRQGCPERHSKGSDAMTTQAIQDLYPGVYSHWHGCGRRAADG